jgi:acyl-CoA synthetase (AMP-forming)/AMP-acid ligase II
MHLTQALHRSLRDHPQRPATIFGDRVRTFAEQADRVARLAGGLRELGVVDGERVAILSLNSDRYLELLLAVPWANGVLVPVNIRWSAAEIAYSLVESDAAVLVVDETFAPMVPELCDAHPGLRAVVYAGDVPAPAALMPEGMVSHEGLVTSSPPIDDARRGGDAVAGIFYTGGTTGFPKGVMLTHGNLVTSALGSQATTPFICPGGRLLHVAPTFHLAGIASFLTHAMLGGSHVVLPGFEAGAALDAIERYEITNTVLVPTMLQLLVDHPELEAHDVSSLRMILYAASPITEALLRRAMKAFPEAEFTQAYGMTELAPTATVLTAEDHRRGERLRSAGRAAAHAEVRIVDAVGKEVPRGTVGEIAVRGGHVMAGYWAKEKETRQAIRDGWMHTGDAAYMDDDGYVFIVDRVKDMIVTGGENVYSAEVEDALASHPAVAICAVIAVPDTTWGERVHAVVVLRPGADASLEELRAHTKQRIAGYKAPRSVEFVDALPMSAAGKVLKRDLRAPHWREAERAVN